ncbi:mitochondrial inner membrane protease subunit 1 [Senna tora]|uniref:Mitochondrial inner membrane protease subunit 1 n=1 Tax=Senna tora TaxID=362788 RepID=A0A834WD72_9FABA|nr:mitochondrial inner membrane protease subunit 1 [Senna tora]
MGQFGVYAKEVWDNTSLAAKIFCFLHVTAEYFVDYAITFGPSMLPTIGVEDGVLLTEKISTRFGRVGRGDIVVVRSLDNPEKFTTKRLIGLEGDSITYVVDPKTSDECKTTVV